MTATTVARWETKLLELKRKILGVSRVEDRLYHELVIARPGLPVDIQALSAQLPSRIQGNLLHHWRAERPCGSHEYHCFFGPDRRMLEAYEDCLVGVQAILKQLPLELYPQDCAIKNVRTAKVGLLKWQRLLNYIAATHPTHLLPVHIICADERNGELGDFGGWKDREFAAGFEMASYILGKRDTAASSYDYWLKRHDDEGLVFPAVFGAHSDKHVFYSSANAIDALLVLAREPMVQTPRRRTRSPSKELAERKVREEVFMVELLSAHHDKDDSRTDEPMSREAILRQLKARVDDRWNETRVTRAMKRVFCLPRAGAAGFRQYKAICDRGGIRPFLAKRVRDGKLLDLEDLQRDLGDGTGRRSRRSDADREDSDQDEDDIVDTEQYLYNGSRVVEIW